MSSNLILESCQIFSDTFVVFYAFLRRKSGSRECEVSHIQCPHKLIISANLQLIISIFYEVIYKWKWMLVTVFVCEALRLEKNWMLGQNVDNAFQRIIYIWLHFSNIALIVNVKRSDFYEMSWWCVRSIAEVCISTCFILPFDKFN